MPQSGSPQLATSRSIFFCNCKCVLCSVPVQQGSGSGVRWAAGEMCVVLSIRQTVHTYSASASAQHAHDVKWPVTSIQHAQCKHPSHGPSCPRPPRMAHTARTLHGLPAAASCWMASTTCRGKGALTLVSARQVVSQLKVVYLREQQKKDLELCTGRK